MIKIMQWSSFCIHTSHRGVQCTRWYAHDDKKRQRQQRAKREAARCSYVEDRGASEESGKSSETWFSSPWQERKRKKLTPTPSKILSLLSPLSFVPFLPFLTVGVSALASNAKAVTGTRNSDHPCRTPRQQGFIAPYKKEREGGWGNEKEGDRKRIRRKRGRKKRREKEDGEQEMEGERASVAPTFPTCAPQYVLNIQSYIFTRTHVHTRHACDSSS
jgi:hypothetical protein